MAGFFIRGGEGKGEGERATCSAVTSLPLLLMVCHGSI